MKKIVLFFLVLFSSFPCKSQALVFQGSEWFCSYQNIAVNGVEHVEHLSDSIILDTQVHILTRSVQANDWAETTSYSFSNDPMFVYSTESEVYHYVQDEFKLLYNLSAEVGDTLETFAEENDEGCGIVGFSVIDSTGSMNINGLDLDFIRLVDGVDSPVSYYGYIFERIGPIGNSFTSTEGHFVPFVNLSDCDLVDYGVSHSGFKCYSDYDFFFSKQDTSNVPCEYQPIGIEEFNINNLSIYPNPSSGRFVVELPVVLPRSETFALSVFNALGKVVFNQDDVMGEQFEFDLSDFSDGVYMVMLNSEYGSYSSKIIKQ